MPFRRSHSALIYSHSATRSFTTRKRKLCPGAPLGAGHRPARVRHLRNKRPFGNWFLRRSRDHDQSNKCANASKGPCDSLHGALLFCVPCRLTDCVSATAREDRSAMMKIVSLSFPQQPSDYGPPRRHPSRIEGVRSDSQAEFQDTAVAGRGSGNSRRMRVMEQIKVVLS